MEKRLKKCFLLAGVMFLFFVVFTCFVRFFDVQPIGPEQSAVGLATVNLYIFTRTGIHMTWYYITDWLGVIAILCAFGFALLGMIQFVRRKSLKKVDKPLLLLGGFYVLAVICYLFFEKVVVNFRPIILNTELEASYPSSHTMLVICIMTSAVIALRALFPARRKLLRLAGTVSTVLIAVTVAGRLVSGVHWFTDIVGGLLLSAALVLLYDAAISWSSENKKYGVS